MRTNVVSRVLGVLLIVAMVLSVLPALASSPADTADTLAVDSELEASEPGGKVYQVTLITGDVVTVTISGDGQRSFAISPADPSKLGQQFLTIEQRGDTYIIPEGIDLAKLDMELFNIDYLVDEQYYEQASLPLLVTYLPSLAESQVRALEDKVGALGQGTERYGEVSTIATQLAYENISASSSSLVSQPEVNKIWLDRKVQAQLMDSVPLIGAPSWWSAGYNGTGTKIAILDTGVDSSHPDLDDLDDNPATTDPKVVVNINLTDDANFNDLFGHGTHVAGIAAGTGSVPGFWNLFGTKQLTIDPAPDMDSAWSPLGDKIAFISDRDGSYDIFIYDVATGNTSKLLTLSSNETGPAWSADGARIAFGRSGALSEETGVWVVSANGTGLARVYGDGIDPTWRPDGSELAFNYTSDNNSDIWAINVSGNTTSLRRITSSPARDWRPAWSPDGSMIAFTSNRTAPQGIWTVSANDTELNPIRLATASASGEPAWSADGTWLAYEAPPLPWGMYQRIGAVKMDASGRQITLIAEPTLKVGDPTWSPSGNQLAYTVWQAAGGLDIYLATKPQYGIRGVAPGAKLWNVKVLNQWGWGYWSWVINGINFASLGPDGVAGSGDEADIINLSLGGGVSDGTDPVSQAVNLAVERGLVVAVAAGNAGYYGMFTISTPGVAEKAFTVGASEKNDTLAYFSSRGPTIDLRIKPDILAPGVKIISSVTTNLTAVINDPSGYKPLSGTSMATPHVAGAAALLWQYYGDNATPQMVKDTLMSTAKDLGYNVYEQGSGRLDLSLPWSKVRVTPASLSLGQFGSANTTASGNLTFFNTDNISHTVTLSANLTDIFSGINYSANVTFSSANFTLPPSGNLTVTLGVNLTSLPASGYSGKVRATVDGGVSRTIHAIFGFAKLREVTVHKINSNGAPAQGHPLWVLIGSPVQGMLTWGTTNASGNLIVDLIDGNYHLISPNWKHAENQTTIWTVAENITISSDMTITLDERETKIIDFKPNKAGQVIPDKTSSLYYNFDDQRYGWASWWWYPSSFLTRVSPISRFDASFSYNYYSKADFIPDNPKLVNTGEWHNLLYSTENITDNRTFIADYANLVHRWTRYAVALNKERAEWAQWSWDNIGSSWGSFLYEMDAPRGRWEWLSPKPVNYGQWYAKAKPWGEWYYIRWGSSNLPGEYVWRMGGHPLRSGVNFYIGWNVKDGVNRLNIWGPISQDTAGNDFANQQAKFSGQIKVIQSDNVVLGDNISDWFNRSVYFKGNPRFTVEVWGKAKLALSGGSYTRLDFTANSTGDYHPPRLAFLVPNIDLSGVVPSGENVTLRVQVTDQSLIEKVGLKYSLDDGSNWADAGLPTFDGTYYYFNFGPLQAGTFVTLAVDAVDVFGNKIHRNTWRAFYVGLPSVTTNTATNITAASAALRGTLTSLGTATTANVSFLWGTTSGKLKQETAAQVMTTTGNFSAVISSLSANTTYYFQAKAAGDGISYGAERSFATLTLTTVEVNLGNSIILAPGQAITSSTSGGIPIDVKNIATTAQGLAAFHFTLNWNPAVIRVDTVRRSVAAADLGWGFTIGAINNTTGTVTFLGTTTQTPYSKADLTLAYLGITAVGSAGGNTTITLSITNLADNALQQITPRSAVNAPVMIVNLLAETSLSQGLSSNTSGIVVVKVNIDRIKNISDNTTANISGGIGSYTATVIGNPSSIIQFLTVYGVSPFNGPSFNVTTGVFSVAVVSSPIQANNTTVAEVVPILTGNSTTSVSLSVSFQSIRAAGDPALNVPEERANTITLLRGDADNNGVISVVDSLAIKQYLVGQLTLSQINPLNAASPNHDGASGDKISVVDALAIEQFKVGQRNAYYQ